MARLINRLVSSSSLGSIRIYTCIVDVYMSAKSSQSKHLFSLYYSGRVCVYLMDVYPTLFVVVEYYSCCYALYVMVRYIRYVDYPPFLHLYTFYMNVRPFHLRLLTWPALLS